MNQHQKLGTLAARGVGIWFFVNGLYFFLVTMLEVTQGFRQPLWAIVMPSLKYFLAGFGVYFFAQHIGRLMGKGLD